MTARILDGKATAAVIKRELAGRVARLAGRGVVPGLGTVLVGDDPGSRAYVNGKHRDCAEVGIASIRRELPADATREQVEAVIGELNADPACTGYRVQLPLPAGLDGARSGPDDPAKERTACTCSTSACWCWASPGRCRARRAGSSSRSAATRCRSPGRTPP